jgi:hypothetical protein
MDIGRRKLLGSPYQLYDGQVSAADRSRFFKMVIDSKRTRNFLGRIFVFCYCGNDHVCYFIAIIEDVH